jgi:glycerol kinase
MQLQADLLGAAIACSDVADVTAIEVGYLAGLGCGLWRSLADLPKLEATSTIYEPRPQSRAELLPKYDKWKKACWTVVELANQGIFDESGSPDEE